MNTIENVGKEFIAQSAATDSDDDVPQLSAEALKALQDFYKETESKSEKCVEENWQLSQFWYDKKTSDKLSEEVFQLALEYFKEKPSEEDKFNVACISCPTLFRNIHSYLNEPESNPQLHAIFKGHLQTLVKRLDVKVFEYDRRFEMYGSDFIYYDYKTPLNLDAELAGKFQLIISDPPFLSDECHIKTGMTVKKIGRPDFKLIICTGAVMEDLLASSFKVKLNKFVPRHEKNLANEFKCYSNYEPRVLDKDL